MTKVVFFDDLYVGQPLRSEAVEVTQEQIIRFARDNDPQYFHVDPDAAKESLFGGLIASGWQTGALTLRLLLDFCGLAFAGGVIGTDTRISWKRPVRPGDRLHIEGEITKLRPSRSQTGRGYVTFEASTYNQDGVAVQTIEATMLALRRPDEK